MTTAHVFPAMLLLAALAAARSAAAQTLTYPPAKRGDVVDDHFGTKVPDPYRWLEDVDAPDTRAWIEAENQLSNAYLAAIPQRAAIERRLTAVWNYARYSAPFHKGGRYFFFKNDGLQNQAVLYTQDGVGGTPRVLLDPNTLSADGTVALAVTAPSEDGRYLAYATAASGSDWNEIHVRDVTSGQDLADHVQWVKFSGIAWTHDGAGFFYSRYPAPEGGNPMLAVNHDQKLYYHKLGTDQAQDALVYERPDHPDWGIGGSVSDDGRYLVLFISLGTDSRNRLYYTDLGDGPHPNLHAPVVPLLDDFDAGYNFVGNDGPVFFVQTDLDAPRGRVIAIETRTPARAGWRTVLAQGPDAIESVGIVHRTFVTVYLHDAHSQLKLFALDGTPAGDIALPTLGAVGDLQAQANDTEFFYGFASFLYPTTIFRHDFTSGRTTVFKAPTLGFDPSSFVTEQVFYTSKDGTRVPMFLVHKKTLVRDGQNPTLLYGYGGFDINMTPAFSATLAVWLEMGGVYAAPNLRGGGEY